MISGTDLQLSVFKQRFAYVLQVVTDFGPLTRFFLSEEDQLLRRQIMAAEGEDRTLHLLQRGEQLIEKLHYPKHPNREVSFLAE